MIPMKGFKEELKQRLTASLSKQELYLLPSGFQKIGDIMVLNLNPKLETKLASIGAAALNVMPKIKTVCAKTGGITGNLRVPNIRRIAGNGTETVHIENGCKYKLDVTKVMFAKGNVRERCRLPAIIKQGETVVDMFAGIGYFSIPIAKHAKPEMIVAIEKNPESIKYLKENIKLNKTSNIEVVENDNRKVNSPDIADRVIMGYLPNTEKFLPSAFKFLKQNGGTIHFHNTYKKQDLWELPATQLETVAKQAGYKLTGISHKAIVKHFAPGIEHVVIDAHYRASS